jgi:hypothetical protein
MDLAQDPLPADRFDGVQDRRGDQIKIAKNSGPAGFHSHITFVKETQTGIVLRTQTAGRATVDRAAGRILRLLNQGSERDADIEETVDEPEEPETGS